MRVTELDTLDSIGLAGKTLARQGLLDGDDWLPDAAEVAAWREALRQRGQEREA